VTARRPTTAARRTPRQPRAVVTRDAMLTAAERVLARDGAAGLNTNRVAEVAGVSIGSVYQYFPNKQALVAALIERNTSQFVAVVARVLDEHRGAPPEVAALAMAVGIRAAFAQQGDVHLDLFEQISMLGLTRALEDALGRITDALAGWIAHNPRLAVPDPPTTAWVIVRAVEGIMRAHAIRIDRRDEDRVALEAAAMVLRYLPRRS
jgi:AcrR family transcriptional regulator